MKDYKWLRQSDSDAETSPRLYWPQNYMSNREYKCILTLSQQTCFHKASLKTLTTDCKLTFETERNNRNSKKDI